MLTLKNSWNLKRLASLVTNVNHVFLFGDKKFATTSKEKVFSFIEDTEEAEEIAAKEALIERKRNKSQLSAADYNRQHDKKPFDEPKTEFQKTLGYRRRLYGKYGSASKVDPSILWPSEKEINAMKEYESVLQPFNIHELIEKSREKKETEARFRAQEEAKILEKVKNVENEIIAFHKRVAAKKKQALELIEKKNKLIEQVRRHFGYNIDERDEKFTAMLAKLQKEENKKIKTAKKLLYEEKKQGKQAQLKVAEEGSSTEKPQE